MTAMSEGLFPEMRRLLGDAPLRDAALPPFGLSPVSRSQRYRAAAAITGMLRDMIDRQDERCAQILRGEVL